MTTLKKPNGRRKVVIQAEKVLSTYRPKASVIGLRSACADTRHNGLREAELRAVHGGRQPGRPLPESEFETPLGIEYRRSACQRKHPSAYDRCSVDKPSHPRYNRRVCMAGDAAAVACVSPVAPISFLPSQRYGLFTPSARPLL